MAEVTTEMVIDELLELDTRLEKLVASKDEMLAYARETRVLIERERKAFREQLLLDELKRLRRDAAE